MTGSSRERQRDEQARARGKSSRRPFGSAAEEEAHEHVVVFLVQLHAVVIDARSSRTSSSISAR